MKRYSWLLMVGMVLATTLTLVGCNAGSVDSIQGALAPATNAPSYTNSAQVRLAIRLDDNHPNADILRPAIRSSHKAAAEVSLRLTSIQVGADSDDIKNRVIIRAATATVENGVANLVINNVPTLPTVANVQINGGTLGGLTSFHGAADLVSGDNKVAVSPFGSRLRQDLTAHVLECAVTSRSLVARALGNMTEDAKGVVNSLANRTQTALGVNETAFNKYAEKRNLSTMTKIQVSSDKNAILGYQSGRVLWSKGNLDIWNEGDFWSFSPIDVLFSSILRQGLDGVGYLTCAHSTHFPFAVVKIDAASGTRLAYVRNRGQCDAAFALPDGSIVVGGTHADKGCPVLFRWNGTESGITESDLGPAQNLAWAKYFDGRDGVSADNLRGTASEPYPAVLSVQYDGNSVILAAVRDAQNNKVKNYRFDATTGNRLGEPVVAVPNQMPTCAITAPASGSQQAEGSPVTLAANAADNDGIITKVEFMIDGALVGAATTTPYMISWARPLAGTHVLTAKAYDNSGAVKTSAAIAFSVGSKTNLPPSVELSSPFNGEVFQGGMTITVTASAWDADGEVTKVEFFDGTNKLGEAVRSPFIFSWSNPAVGNHTLTAKATDNTGATKTSSSVNVTVEAVAVGPTVSIASPTEGTSFKTTDNITLSATVTAPEGINRVEFLNGSTVLTSKTAEPYSHVFTIPTAGSYVLTVKVVDAKGNIKQASVNVTINSATVEEPTVTLNSPINGSSFAVGDPISLTAAAAVGGADTITRVDFFQGSSLIGSASMSPFIYQWTPWGVGTFTITARAYTSAGAIKNSAPVTIRVAARPEVSIGMPTNGMQFNQGAMVGISAYANVGGDMFAIKRVEFYVDNQLVASMSMSPFYYSYMGATPGSHTVYARAISNDDVTQDSPIVTFGVVSNTPPTVSVTSPTPGSTLTVGTSVYVIVTANDTDGSVSSVDIYDNGAWVGAANRDPTDQTRWTFPWMGASGGQHALTARANDNGGAMTESSVVNFSLADTAPPYIVTRSPSQSASGVLVGQTIQLNFNEKLNPDTINSNNIMLRQGATFESGSNVMGNVTYFNQGGTMESTVVTFTPSSQLSFGQMYWVRVVGGSAGLKDLAGNGLTGEYATDFVTWNFNTQSRTAFESLSAGNYISYGGFKWIKLNDRRMIITESTRPGYGIGFDQDGHNLFEPSGTYANNVGAYLNGTGNWSGIGFYADLTNKDWLEQYQFDRQCYTGTMNADGTGDLAVSGSPNPVTMPGAWVGLLSVADWIGLDATTRDKIKPTQAGTWAMWLLTPYLNNEPTNQAIYMVNQNGVVSYQIYDVTTGGSEVRPVVQLRSGYLFIQGGSGTESDPYQLTQ